MPDSTDLPLEIDVAALNQMRLEDQEFLLLDVREPDEYAIAKIDGSVLIPMGELGDRLDELEQRRDRLIIVQCHHGHRSMHVTQALRNRGFANVQNLAGGIDQWSQQIDPAVPRY